MLLGALTCTAGVYAFWWLFLEPTRYAWLRRILNGLVLQQALAVFVGWRCIQSLKTKNQTPAENAMTGKGWSIGLVPYAVLLAAVLITSTIVLERGQVLTRSPEPTLEGAHEIAFAEAVRKLPSEATLFGVGWWQAPVVALYSGRHMENLESWPSRDLTAIREKYLVLDSYALALDPQTVARLQATYDLDPIVVCNAGTISRIRRERSLIARIGNATNGIRSMIALDREDYAHQTGVFDREGSMRWASPRIKVLLWRTNQQRVAAEVTLPPGLMGFSGGRQNHEPVALTLSVEGCAQVTQTIIDPDRRRIEATLTCAPVPQGAPLEVVLTLNTQLDPRAIAPDVRPLAFMIHSVELLGSTDRSAGDVPGP
jgi:hypothetical protein